PAVPIAEHAPERGGEGLHEEGRRKQEPAPPLHVFGRRHAERPEIEGEKRHDQREAHHGEKLRRPDRVEIPLPLRHYAVPQTGGAGRGRLRPARISRMHPRHVQRRRSMATRLPLDRLAALRQYSSPTVANAIETFNLRPRTAGFMSSQIRCIFPELGAMVGYAFTATIRASQQPPPEAAARRPASWRGLEEIPAPRVMVLQALDDPPGVGAL